MAIAKFLCDEGKALKINVCAKGGNGAANAPCKNLAVTTCSKLLENPQKKEEMINPITLINKIYLISYLVEIHPAKGVKIAVATIFPVTDHVI